MDSWFHSIRIINLWNYQGVFKMNREDWEFWIGLIYGSVIVIAFAWGYLIGVSVK